MATSKKQPTNESRLKKLIAENSPILNALLLERILKIAEITAEDMRENPEDWERSIISPSLWYQLIDNINEVLNDNKKDWEATTQQDEQRYHLKHS
jgi:hypothetical protein